MFFSDNFDIISQLEQIDYASIIKIFGSVIFFYAEYQVIETYKLRKVSKCKTIKEVSLPPVLEQKYSDIDLEKLASKELGDKIINFAKFMVNKFSAQDLTIFYNNLNTLEVEFKSFHNFILGNNTAGIYKGIQNKIEIQDANAIYHELFHMASTVDDFHSGFSQGALCMGINEGYTQFLAKRYFNDLSCSNVYENLEDIVEVLEKLVGREKMESLYFRADLLGLVNELKKYATEEEIFSFISSADSLLRYDGVERYFCKDIYIYNFRNANDFLLKANTRKLKEQLDNGVLSEAEFDEMLDDLVNSLVYKFKVGNSFYETLFGDHVQEFLRDILDAPNLIFETDLDVSSNKKRI